MLNNIIYQLTPLTTNSFIDIGGVSRLKAYTVAQAESLSAETVAGSLIYVSNGYGGLPTIAFSNSTNWLNIRNFSVIASS
jgi:hypothetical protein